MIHKLVRGIITLLFGVFGFYLAYLIKPPTILQSFGWQLSETWLYAADVVLVVAFVIVGYLIAPISVRGFLFLIRWMDNSLQRVPTYELMGGAIGVIIGLIISSLFSNSFVGIPFVGPLLSIILSVFLGYLGLIIGTRRKEEVLGFFNIFPKFRDKSEKGEKQKESKNRLPDVSPNYKVLDTSVIIDGRIADIVQTGFVEGILLIPSFVLEELRHIADSSDLLKRNRGRRGLDILNQISKETLVKVQIHEQDFDDISEVDSKLVRLGQILGAPILTNDYNLNKVAEIQGVKVLNINELANAVKPVVLPGEEMVVQVMKEGKEPGQGVAYLDDGTMIVVDTGRRYMGQHLTVLVTSVLQTAAGRMIFAKPKVAIEKKQLGLSPTDEVNAIG